MKQILIVMAILLGMQAFASPSSDEVFCEGAARFQRVKLWLGEEGVDDAFLMDNYLTNRAGGETTCSVESYADSFSKKVICSFSGGPLDSSDMSVEITLMRGKNGDPTAFGFMNRSEYYGGETYPLWCKVKKAH